LEVRSNQKGYQVQSHHNDQWRRIIAEAQHTGHEELEDKEVAVLKFKIFVKQRIEKESTTEFHLGQSLMKHSGCNQIEIRIH
jgi:hypothetical protein